MRQDDKEARTYDTIQVAFGSYLAAINSLMELQPQPLGGRIRGLSRADTLVWRRLRDDYNRAYSIDKRQNVEGQVERSTDAIRKACQYAQAFLVHDLRGFYSLFSSDARLKARMDQLIATEPKSIQLRLGTLMVPDSRLAAVYRDRIRDPVSAARVIGESNTPESFTEYVGTNIVVDQVFEWRMSGIFPEQEG